MKVYLRLARCQRCVGSCCNCLRGLLFFFLSSALSRLTVTHRPDFFQVLLQLAQPREEEMQVHILGSVRELVALRFSPFKEVL